MYLHYIDDIRGQRNFRKILCNNLHFLSVRYAFHVPQPMKPLNLVTPYLNL